MESANPTTMIVLICCASLGGCLVLVSAIFAWLFWHLKGAEQRLQTRFQLFAQDAIRLVSAMRLSEAGGHNAQVASSVISNGSAPSPIDEAFRKMFPDEPEAPYDLETEMVN